MIQWNRCCRALFDCCLLFPLVKSIVALSHEKACQNGLFYSGKFFLRVKLASRWGGVGWLPTQGIHITQSCSGTIILPHHNEILSWVGGFGSCLHRRIWRHHKHQSPSFHWPHHTTRTPHTQHHCWEQGCHHFRIPPFHPKCNQPRIHQSWIRLWRITWGDCWRGRHKEWVCTW